MKSLAFPDVNVRLALLLEDHAHRAQALRWWEATSCETIAFSRLTRTGVLRLLTTDAAMNGQPLTMPAVWSAYDRLFVDDRVALLTESPGLEERFRGYASLRRSSPKLWADADLAAFAAECEAALVSFDSVLARRAPHSVLFGAREERS